LLGEGLGTRAQPARERFEIEGEAGLALRARGGSVGARDGDDGRVGFGKIEMRTDAQADFVAREQFGAGPVENAAEIAVFEKFQERGGEVVGGAGLAEFVGVEFRRAAGGPVGEQTLMERAAAAGAVAHEERGANGGGMGGCDGVDGAFAGDFLRGVSIYRMRRIVRGVGCGALSVENLFGGKVEEAGVEFARETGEELGEGDIHRFGACGIGVALRGFGDRGAVDDRVGRGGVDGGVDGGGVREIEDETLGEPGDFAGETADDSDDFVAAGGGELGEVAADEAGGAGEEEFHGGRA